MLEKQGPATSTNVPLRREAREERGKEERANEGIREVEGSSGLEGQGDENGGSGARFIDVVLGIYRSEMMMDDRRVLEPKV